MAGADSRDKRQRDSPSSRNKGGYSRLVAFYQTSLMAYALTTTKRKFHRILDSISNSSNTSSPLKPPQDNGSSTTLTEPAAKKLRPSRPNSVFVVPTTQTLVEEGKISRTTSLIKSESPKNKAKPNFTPWDREDFLERLKTFRHVHLWMTKPDRVNEVEWAKRGWRFVAQDRVACGGCGKEVVMKLEPEKPREHEEGDDVVFDEEWRQAAQDELVGKYAEMIITEHDERCLWRKRGCDATIQRLPLAHPATTLDGLRSRYESLLNLNFEMPTSLRTPAGFDFEGPCQALSPTLLQISPSDSISDSSAPAPEINESALKFALFGWQGETEHGLALATCNACFRRLGLWLFVPRVNPNDPSEEKEAIVNRLELAGEHRLYCPWINGASQSGGAASSSKSTETTELAGWEMLVRAIRNSQHIQQQSDFSGASDPPSASAGLDKAARDVKDQERWAKLKKLRQAFSIKRVKKVEKENLARPSTAG